MFRVAVNCFSCILDNESTAVTISRNDNSVIALKGNYYIKFAITVTTRYFPAVMGRFRRCREVLRDFAVDSTFHGLPHTVTSPLPWLRVMWLIIIVAAMCVGLMQITWLFNYYLSKPIEVDTKISVTLSLKNSLRQT